jgi:putative transcriptional regulator
MKNNVKFLRRNEKFDLTQDALAKALGVSRGTVANMEKGGDISGALLLKTAAFFEKDPRDIFFLQ